MFYSENRDQKLSRFKAEEKNNNTEDINQRADVTNELQFGNCYKESDHPWNRGYHIVPQMDTIVTFYENIQFLEVSAIFCSEDNDQELFRLRATEKHNTSPETNKLFNVRGKLRFQNYYKEPGH